ncbi:hypothetical protein MERGE_002395 [Pneumocystis wakefieldiae]|uniref:Nucleolar complex protein 2 n=1 Tax=Pneumocystis wakefieldiae TaxID=38082 RepID=A0A899FM70_9ASCO|nr:hypothetical protein MERGE_002395 [Pneumocystis wakefieldiae]
MAKISKSTKKFEKKRLQKALKRRREAKKIKNRYNSPKNHDIRANIEDPEGLEQEGSGLVDSFSKELSDSLSEGISQDNESDDLSLKGNYDHKAQLEALKDEDPEFYKYLKEEEAELLAFEDSEISDTKKIEDGSKKDDIDHKVLTLYVINKWKKTLVEEKSVKILKKVVVAVHTAIQSDERTGFSENSFITDPEVFNALIVLAFKQTFYAAFVQQSSHTNTVTLPFICFMKNSASKLFGVDQVISYQVSFKCIRQLAIYLRNAIIKHDKESCSKVYNWKYVHSIDFWSLVLSNNCNKIEKNTRTSVMRDLIYPLIQVTLGTIKFVTLVEFFPLKFHLIRSVIRISHHTKVYIPLAPYIFEVLESKEIKNKPNPSTAKPIDFELCISAPKSYLKGKVYQDGLIEQIIELLQETYSLQCKSISFPEMAMPIIIQIKRYMKQSKNSKLNKLLSIFIEKLEENSEFINSQRSSIEFLPENIDKMNAFLEDYDWDKTPLGRYVCQQRRIRQKLKKVEE